MTTNRGDDIVEVVDLTKEESVVIDITTEPEPPKRRQRGQPLLINLGDESPTNHRSPEPAPRPRLKRPRPPDSPPNTLKCPICLEPYANVKKNGHKVVVTRCGHIFCDFCLKKAISENGRKCPKCRKAIPKGVTGIIEIFDVC